MLIKHLDLKSNDRFFEILVFILSIFVFSTSCYAQDKLKNKILESGLQLKTEISESAPQEIVDSPSSAFVQYAKSAGVRKCLGRIDQVVRFLMGNSGNVGGHYFLPSPDPDNMMVSLSMEIPQLGNVPAYASASFAPNQANGCGSIYETVVYWPQNCEIVARQHYSGMNRLGALSNKIIILDGGPTLRIFLMPAGTGCIVIKKELIQ
jgi:hypothetical protein